MFGCSHTPRSQGPGACHLEISAGSSSAFLTMVDSAAEHNHDDDDVGEEQDGEYKICWLC